MGHTRLKDLSSPSEQVASDRRARKYAASPATPAGPAWPQCGWICASDFSLRNYLHRLQTHNSRQNYQSGSKTSWSKSTDYWKQALCNIGECLLDRLTVRTNDLPVYYVSFVADQVGPKICFTATWHRGYRAWARLRRLRRSSACVKERSVADRSSVVGRLRRPTTQSLKKTFQLELLILVIALKSVQSDKRPSPKNIGQQATRELTTLIMSMAYYLLVMSKHKF